MPRPKDLGLEHTWRLRLSRQATSGLSITAFCQREGVSTPSFYAWKRRLAPPRTATPGHPPLFVPIRLDSMPPATDVPSSLSFEIELPHHIRLRCAAPPDPVWLGRLVTALASSTPEEDRP